MEELTVTGIVLSSMPYKDKDKLIHIFTVELGVVTGILKGVAAESGALFFDAATVAGPGSDQLHMTAESHERLASALYEIIKEYFESREVRN